MPVLLKSKKPKFVGPSKSINSLDGICAKIVEELSTRKWNVEGIEVEFGYNETDNFTYIHQIKGKDFVLIFERGLFGLFTSSIGVSHVLVPGRIVNLEHFPQMKFYIYKGDNWGEAVRDLDATPLRNRSFRGGNDWEYSYTILHMARGNVKIYLDEVCAWLDRHVLDYIICQPTPTKE